MPTTYAIPNGATQFAATLWTGNSGTQSINNGASTSGTSFQPDFAWVKKRTGTDNHELTDSVRGNNLRLASNTTDQQSAGGIAFASNGLTLTGGFGTDNQTGFTYVGYQWKANGAAITNTAGLISSQVSANQTAGFSIVTWTGDGSLSATVGHGLNATPKMIIQKGRDSSVYSWRVYTSTITAGNMLLLNSTSPQIAIDGNGGISSVGLSTFGFSGGVPAVNANTERYVAYCFSEIAGYSKFGSYTGTGVAATAPFVYLGFKPRLIMLKAITTGSSENWIFIDTARNPVNVNTNQWLYPNLPAQEGATTAPSVVDILSNGFKLRGFTGTPNTSAVTYIYAAFAENPFKYANAQ